MAGAIAGAALGCTFDPTAAGGDVPLGDGSLDATTDATLDAHGDGRADGDARSDGDTHDGDACATTCDAGDPCKDAVLDCVDGAPHCSVVGPRPDGTPCGTAKVCNAGACVACPSGTTCTPTTPCRLGAIDCSSGAPVCGVVDTAPDGEKCGTGRSCRSGACACDAPTTDCGGTCVDLASSSANCGTCGHACTLSCMSSACQSWLGMFELGCDPAACAALSCTYVNDRTGACTCPTGAAGWGSDLLYTELAYTVIGVCYPPTLAPNADFGGVYILKDVVAGCMAPNPAGGVMPLPASGCDVVNPYTGGCSCPAGHVAASTRLEVYCDDGTSKVVGGWLALCWSATAPQISFGGAYELRDDGGCASPNPATGACSCPSGATPRGYRVHIDVPSSMGATLFVCDR
jgi:hypothetical protein